MLNAITHASPTTCFFQGVLSMFPLCIAVLPWGILAGSYAVEVGLTALESQAMSAVLFAGSIQLVALGMFEVNTGLLTLLVTTFFITSRHCLYSIAMRSKISPLPFYWRITLGFLLTDELFAVANQRVNEAFNRWFALGAGLSFYLFWNLATLFGIIAGSYLPILSELGLEFAVAATFIAIVIPQVKSIPVLVSVISAIVLSIIFSLLQIGASLLFASLGAMLAGFFSEQLWDNNKEKRA